MALLASLGAFGQTLPEPFRRHCAACHGDNASGTDRGPNLIDTRSLRARSDAAIRGVIREGTRGGMPGFPLPETDLDTLTRLVRGWNQSAFAANPPGDRAAGHRLFAARCASCHLVHGQGGVNGPGLSEIGRQLSVRELEQVLDNPDSRRGRKNSASCPPWAFCPDDPWAVVRVRMKDGRTLRGFARSRGPHDIQVQSFDGRMHLLDTAQYAAVEDEKNSYMPALKATPAERRDLIAYLAGLDGVPVGPLNSAPAAGATLAAPGTWTGYHGLPTANRHSPLKQVNTANAASLRPAWSYSLPHPSLQTTPLVDAEGVMYVTAPNQVCALDSSTGREIWCYTRARAQAGQVSGDAAKGAQRGAALLGDRVFFATDDAHLIALHRLTGELLWQVYMPPKSDFHYGSTAAPLVADGLVITGVGGGDSPLRGFIAAHDPATGREAWRFWTIPAAGEKGSETWQGSAMPMGGGATWLTGSYDEATGTLYWPTGNPYPDTDGSERKGDNLYTNCVVALNVKTGRLKWHFQYTPHDLWDWDATEPLVLVDTTWKGVPRKLLLQANRNGYFYVLDRLTGEFLLGTPFVKQLTWSRGIDARGRPIVNEAAKPTLGGTVVCPAVRGATNWYSTAFNPATRLFYVMAVEDCNVYRQAGSWFVPHNDPAQPPRKLLRAINIETGSIAWEIPQVGAPESNYSGVLSTEGGLIFYGESGGTFAAADARTGRTLWHFPTGQAWKASPMTYTAKGRQHIAIAAGGNILSFRLP